MIIPLLELVILHSTLSAYRTLNFLKVITFVIQNSNVAIGRTLVGITTLDGLNGMANYPDSVVGIMRTEQEFIDGVYE